jgi:hypothetical protein
VIFARLFLPFDINARELPRWTGRRVGNALTRDALIAALTDIATAAAVVAIGRVIFARLLLAFGIHASELAGGAGRLARNALTGDALVAALTDVAAAAAVVAIG